MDIDKLNQSFSEISELLNSPNLLKQLKQDAELGKKIEKFQTLVEEVRLQHGDLSVSKDDILLSLEEIDTILSYLSKYCESNLIRLDFLKHLKPLN